MRCVISLSLLDKPSQILTILVKLLKKSEHSLALVKLAASSCAATGGMFSAASTAAMSTLVGVYGPSKMHFLRYSSFDLVSRSKLCIFLRCYLTRNQRDVHAHSCPKIAFCAVGELLNIELLNNELLNGELLNDELLNGELLNGELLNGELLNSELLNGELLNGELLNGELLNGELLNGELLNGELPNGELLKGTGSELAY
ncbi:hypothetical protein Tco_0561680 [Tanacetum coccineum]